MTTRNARRGRPPGRRQRGGHGGGDVRGGGVGRQQVARHRAGAAGSRPSRRRASRGPTTATRAAARRASASRSRRRSSAESSAARAVPVAAAASRSARSTQRRTTVMPVGVRSRPATSAASQLAPVTAASTGTLTTGACGDDPPAPADLHEVDVAVRHRVDEVGDVGRRSTSSVTPAFDPLPPNALPLDFTSSPTVTPESTSSGRGRLLTAGACRGPRTRRPPGPWPMPGDAEPVDLDDDPALLGRVGRATADTGSSSPRPTGRVRTTPSRSSAAERYRPVTSSRPDRRWRAGRRC